MNLWGIYPCLLLIGFVRKLWHGNDDSAQVAFAHWPLTNARPPVRAGKNRCQTVIAWLAWPWRLPEALPRLSRSVIHVVSHDLPRGHSLADAPFASSAPPTAAESRFESRDQRLVIDFFDSNSRR